MINSNILIYQNDNGNIKAIFEEELHKEAVVRNYRTTTSSINMLYTLAEKRG